jgi:hypothetical protein
MRNRYTSSAGSTEEVHLEKNAISTRWFPACGLCERNAWLSDKVYKDFDHQAEQLSGHDQSYLQLTAGPFRGRFL